MSDLYAKMFVSTARTRAELLAVVAKALDGARRGSTVVTPECEADVRGNDDYSPEALGADPTDFVYFPYTVEIFSSGEDPRIDAFLETASFLMNHLFSAGMKVVVACDWEDQLPGRGKLGL